MAEPQEQPQDIFNQGSKELQEIFKELALKEGWPKEIVGQVKINMNPDGVNLSYDDSLDDQIFDLEYGKFQQPPAAALRKLQQIALRKYASKKESQAFSIIRESGVL